MSTDDATTPLNVILAGLRHELAMRPNNQHGMVVATVHVRTLVEIAERAQAVAEIAMPDHGTLDKWTVQERTALHILGSSLDPES